MADWEIINNEVLQHSRAEYGKNIIATLSRQLEAEYGGSFSEKNLRRMMQFASIFQEDKIVATLSRQLSWSHIKELIPIAEPLKREFYIQLCIHEKWSVRLFRERI